ncbi:hypothetical protein ACAG26_00735 [Mycobacterium sp. pUA109]|uniref:hypothetical protein n=1 Tax=Mycobacterium sp. pUA109 TaxID=3238982 RepID=UPI00351B3C65
MQRVVLPGGLCAAACVWASAVLPPAAAADPGQFPDLSGYTAVDASKYATYYNYPTSGGVQFVAPAGYRCRITYTLKANYGLTQCWGALPATSANVVTVTRGPTALTPGAFGTADLAEMDKYRTMGKRDVVDATFGPEAYQPLPAGSKVSWDSSGTCGVDDTTTACVMGSAPERHGFVLSAQGSWTF